MKLTIQDIADRAGVSKTTVSRVLNGRFDLMGEETRKRVLEVIRESNYQPNVVAQSLKRGKTGTIGVILPTLINFFYPEFLKGIEAFCRKEGYSIILCDSNEDPAEERQYIRTLRARRVDGLIISSSGENNECYSELILSEFPVVFADRVIDGLDVDMAVVDDYSGAYSATEHLIKLGHRRIGLVVPPINHLSTRSHRLAGYMDVLRDHGIRAEQDLVVIGDPGPGGAYKAVLDLLGGGTRPSAIFVTNALLGLDVVKAIQVKGLKVPSDLALVVFDETPWAPLLTPPLTTVAQPAQELGCSAAKLVIKKIRMKRKKNPEKVLLSPALIVRESCGAKETTGAAAPAPREA